MLKVIISSSHGAFKPKPEFDKVIKSKGHDHLWSIEARTDEDLVQYVENNLNEHGRLKGEKYWSHVTVVEVDTSNPWFIGEYDGAEYIGYVRYEVLNKKLNYVRMTS